MLDAYLGSVDDEDPDKNPDTSDDQDDDTPDDPSAGKTDDRNKGEPDGKDVDDASADTETKHHVERFVPAGVRHTSTRPSNAVASNETEHTSTGAVVTATVPSATVPKAATTSGARATSTPSSPVTYVQQTTAPVSHAASQLTLATMTDGTPDTRLSVPHLAVACLGSASGLRARRATCLTLRPSA